MEQEIRVEFKSQVVISGEPASVRVFRGEELIAEIVAEIELQRGADSGFYHSVKLTKVT